MTDKLKKIIETKLALIDLENRNNDGEKTSFSTKLQNELAMIRITLQALDLEVIEYDINPYFWENGKPSVIKQ